jgi:glutaminase
MQDIQAIVDSIYDSMAPRLGEGKVADYIPELAKVDPNQFGIAITTVDGTTYTAGNALTPFSIQSISKVFMLTLALGKAGETVWNRVGREPSGSSFNSIVQLEHEHGIPRNPFVNAGAIVVTDIVLAGHQPREAIGELLRFVRYLADDDTISIDDTVPQFRACQFHAVLRQSAPSRGIYARRLFPPVRAFHDLRTAFPRRAVSCQSRPQSADGAYGRVGQASAAYQCADADLRPL